MFFFLLFLGDNNEDEDIVDINETRNQPDGKAGKLMLNYIFRYLLENIDDILDSSVFVYFASSRFRHLFIHLTWYIVV